MEEGGLGEGLPRLDVPDRGRAPVAKELEDLETALGEKEERCGWVALQEQRPLGRQQHVPRDGRDFGQLFIVELGEQLRGAQVEQGLCAGPGHGPKYTAGCQPSGYAEPPGAPPTASVGSAGNTTMAEAPSRGHLYSQMPQPMQRWATTLGRAR